ncbi:MAG: hypothetical protein E7269_06100 [Lachnospiraceae bacterium]|nr:hypothetical protein [Lachnospiraceae bacterium]
MKCYNCGSKLTNYHVCTDCGADVTSYSKIVKMSNTYYNMGLAKAANRDLQGAAYMLRHCVKINKYHVNGRNLLGLVYYEMGEIVQALSEWVISKYLQSEGNLAEYYINTIQANQNKLQMINQSIDKFNVALKYAKQGNEDVAIVQLKKVLTQNPNLVKAHQLLALIFYHQGELAKARKAIKKALAVDKCNTLSLKYMREIDLAFEEKMRLSGKRKKEKKQERQKYLSGDDVIIPKTNWYQKSGAGSVLYLMGGVLFGVLLTFFVVMPGRLNVAENKFREKSSSYDQQIQQLNSTIHQYENQVASEQENAEGLNHQILDLQTQLSAMQSDLTKAMDKLQKEGFLDAEGNIIDEDVTTGDTQTPPEGGEPATN